MKGRTIFILCAFMGAAIWVAGCGGASNNNTGVTTTNTSGGNGATVVTNNPEGTVPWTAVDGASNITATMRVNDKGTTVTQIPAVILKASVTTVDLAGRKETNVDDLYSMPTNGRGVYEGDSGSPVLISGNIAGGLFGSADGIHFDARGIAQMEATASGPPSARPQPAARITPHWHIHGPAALLAQMRNRPGFGTAIYEGPVSKEFPPISTAPHVPLIPGLRFASPFVLGTYVVGYDLATYTYELSGGDWVGTAHGLEDAGTVAWPIMGVSVIGPNSDGSIHANPTGEIYGSLLYDGENGSLINPNIAATMMQAPVTLNLNGVPNLSRNEVRFDHGSSTEDTSIETAAESTVDAVLQGNGNSFAGNGTVVISVNGGNVNYNMTFANGLTLDALATSVGAQLDEILGRQHEAAPGAQIQSVQVTLNISTD